MILPANPGGIRVVGRSFIGKSLFVVCEWAKPVIFQHFSSKTCAIINISQGKVNFVIETKHPKGESSKWARKTAKVKQNGRLVMSLHPSFLTYAVSTAILLLCTVYSTFFLCCRFLFHFCCLNLDSAVFHWICLASFYFSEKVVVNDYM